MSCEQWKDEWVADLYGELPAEEATRLADHLASCAHCAERLRRLAGARELLGRCAGPAAGGPRVLVLQPRNSARQAWSFAAGAAAAALLLAAALTWLPTLEPRSDDALRARLAALEQRPVPADDYVSREDLRQELATFGKELRGDRARDVEFLLDELAAVELRTGTQIHTNREALRYAVLASRPGISEQ